MQTLAENWAELGERIRGFVGRRVNDPHAADDITQDVLLKVQSRLDALPAEEKLPAWVFAIARNAIIDHYRARAVRTHDNIEDAELVADSDNAARNQAIAELTPCLLRMVERLPEPYREAMKLADFDGVGQQAIADRAGISLSGAKSRVQRAREQLRAMILDCCHVERDGRGNVVDYQTTERTKGYCGGSDEQPPCGG